MDGTVSSMPITAGAKPQKVYQVMVVEWEHLEKARCILGDLVLQKGRNCILACPSHP